VVTNFFLRAKHWQIFVLIWGTYLAGELLIARLLPTRWTIQVGNPLKVGLLTDAVMLPFLLCSVAWLWSLGLFLFSIAKGKLKLNIRLFKFAVIFSTCWFAMASPLLILSRNLTAKVFLFPTHLLAVSLMLYAFCFVSKGLVAAEKGETVVLSDYAPSLFLFLASVIGIWFIQPRINRLYAREAPEALA